ncbi:hypothetical protein COCNU_11G003510 [Cocos nucifera]|uniref:Uncharacterized protein n=1 Tax=Cocos nucifera TaxID=13894 RepID=A0A8K0IQ45_COCNU|nr:hypothetical protein COCNU_11G003510 [Cocos nucifera]
MSSVELLVGGKGEESQDLGPRRSRRSIGMPWPVMEQTKSLVGLAHEQNGVEVGKVDHGHGVRLGRLDGLVVMEVRPYVRVWDLMDGLELEVASERKLSCWSPAPAPSSHGTIYVLLSSPLRVLWFESLLLRIFEVDNNAALLEGDGMAAEDEGTYFGRAEIGEDGRTSGGRSPKKPVNMMTIG